jgi:hypothetical protein
VVRQAVAAGQLAAAAQPAVVPRAAEVLLVVAELQGAAAEPQAGAARRVVAARPVAVQPVVCLTLVAVPLAVVRADSPLRAVATAVAAAVE